jgi:DNA-binding MarR family transcriptional regulator
MHPIFQSFKRTYWASMRFSRAWISRYTWAYRVTPARFDMMLVISGGKNGCIEQNELREVLDVCPSVVTVMLDSLEDLGYVVRTPLPGFRHANLVTITALGASILAKITKAMLLDGYTECAVRVVLARSPAEDEHTERVIARTRRIVAHFRRRVRDSSTLVYPAYLATGERDPAHPYRHAHHVYAPKTAPKPGSSSAPP